MKRSNWAIVCAGFFALLSNNVILAGNTPGAFTITVSDGWYHFARDRHLDNTSIPNAALAYNLNEHLAIEGGIGVLNTNQKPSLGDEHVHGFLYTLDGIYRFKPCGHFEPYIIAGIGMLSLEKMGEDGNHPGNVNAGLGAQLFWGENIALRGEFRDVYSTTGSGRNDYMVNFGLSLLLGGNAKSATAPVSLKG